MVLSELRIAHNRCWTMRQARIPLAAQVRAAIPFLFARIVADRVDLGGRRVILRPMRADDAAMHEEFIARLALDDLRFRFGNRVDDLPHPERYAITTVDPEREITFVALAEATNGASEIVGEIRTREDADGARAEFAIAVRSDLQGLSLGRALLEKVIAFCRTRHVRLLYGLVDPSNTSMLALARRLSFDIDHVPGGSTSVVSLELGNDAPAEAITNPQ